MDARRVSLLLAPLGALLLGALLGACVTPPGPVAPLEMGGGQGRVQGAGPSAVPALPLLRLSPPSLGRSWRVQQQLHIHVREQPPRHLDALLEADASAVRLALLSMGQTAARLVWDGQQLSETRAPWLPAAVSGERILSDLQLVYWPVAAIRAALPGGWRLTEETTAEMRPETRPETTPAAPDWPEARGSRTLRAAAGDAVVTVRYPHAGRIELVNQREHYRLVIDTRSVDAR